MLFLAEVKTKNKDYFLAKAQRSPRKIKILKIYFAFFASFARDKALSFKYLGKELYSLRLCEGKGIK
jgi:hypothetical protein